MDEGNDGLGNAEKPHEQHDLHFIEDRRGRRRGCSLRIWDLSLHGLVPILSPLSVGATNPESKEENQQGE